MIQITNIEVFNFEGAFRGMRNPMKSWSKSDSYFGLIDLIENIEHYLIAESWVTHENTLREKEGKIPYTYGSYGYNKIWDDYMKWLYKVGFYKQYGNGLYDTAIIGPKDLNLAQKLIKSGSDHSKFMRQIQVSMDIAAPMYWWKEMDTYKVATVANSTSTMHKITSRPITMADFSFDTDRPEDNDQTILNNIKQVIKFCEELRQNFIKTGDKNYWRLLIQILPESYNQTRTWTTNYATLRNIYFSRKNHKLEEWHKFCNMIEDLPWGKELICLK